jgi:hypothetical protein
MVAPRMLWTSIHSFRSIDAARCVDLPHRLRYTAGGRANVFSRCKRVFLDEAGDIPPKERAAYHSDREPTHLYEQ